jgi:hypothetical protein
MHDTNTQDDTLHSWWYFGTKKIKCLIDPKILDPDIPDYIREVYEWEKSE